MSVWIWEVGSYQGWRLLQGMSLISCRLSTGLSAHLCVFSRFSSDSQYPLQIPERVNLIIFSFLGQRPWRKATSSVIHQPLWMPLRQVLTPGPISGHLC